MNRDSIQLFTSDNAMREYVEKLIGGAKYHSVVIDVYHADTGVHENITPIVLSQMPNSHA